MMAASGNSYRAKPVYIVDMRQRFQVPMGQSAGQKPLATSNRSGETDLLHFTSKVISAQRSRSGEVTRSKINANTSQDDFFNDNRPKSITLQTHKNKLLKSQDIYSKYVLPPLPPRGEVREEGGLTSEKQNDQYFNEIPPKLPERTYEIKPPPTPEPVPISRINVTEKDEIWKSDLSENGGPNQETLVPPLRHITIESTEELLRKFNVVDVLDSASEHSDNSSADTMIMMTTEEERKNEEKINRSMKYYESNKKDIKNDHELNKNEMCNGLTTHLTLDTNFVSQESGKSVLRKFGVNYQSSQCSGSPEEENGTDEGYGTNTTVSSPLSSSWSSLLNSDLENSANHGMSHKGMTPTSTTASSVVNTQPSVRTQWAVKRKGRTTNVDSQDNSLQERLRQLAIIEEEENTQNLDEHDYNMQNIIGSEDEIQKPMTVVDANRTENLKKLIIERNSEISDLEDQFSPLLECLNKETIFEKFSDMDRNYRNYCGFEKESSDAIPEWKVNYFQQKVLSKKYGHDNYYRPKYFGSSQDEGTNEQEPSAINRNCLSSHGNGMTKMSVPSIHQISSRMSNGDVDPRFMQQHGINMESRVNHLPPDSNYSRIDSNVGKSLPPSRNESMSQVIQSTSRLPAKGRFMSVDNLYRNCQRPTFASSKDIYKLFQTAGQNSHTLQRSTASHRHSFHAAPVRPQETSQNTMAPPRPRAASTSVTNRSQTSLSCIDIRMAGKENINSHNYSKISVNSKPSNNVNHLSEIPLQTVSVEREEGVRLTTLV